MKMGLERICDDWELDRDSRLLSPARGQTSDVP